MAIPRKYVDPPTKELLPYRLVNAVDWRTDGDSHWKNGIQWQSLCGMASTTLEPCVTGGALPLKIDTGGTEARGASAFTVYAEVDCSAPGGGWERGIEDATRLLEMTESYAVEQAFWTGRAANINNAVYPHLAANTVQTNNAAGDGFYTLTLQTAATVVTGGTGVAAVIGFGALEAAIAACNNGVSVIHVPMIAIPSLLSKMLLVKQGNQLRTITGNVVVPGAGYANTGPDGSPAAVGQAWLYGTGAMFGYRGDVRTFSRETSLDRNVNTLKAIAERTYVLGFECCHYAVLINL